MAGLLTPTRPPRLVTSEQLLRRAIVLLAAEHPTLSDAQLFDVWVERGDEVFTDFRPCLSPLPDAESELDTAQ